MQPEALWILVSMTGIFSFSYRKSATPFYQIEVSHLVNASDLRCLPQF